MTSHMAISPVDPRTFDLSTGAGAHLVRIVEESTRADGRSPLNEAALLALEHHGLDGSTLLVAGSGAGFAWVHGPADEHEVDLVV